VAAPLRLLIFDRTCRGRRLLPGLSHAWGAGRHLYGALGRLDAALGAASWGEALAWLGAHQAPAPIAEIQFWGHGRWGQARIAREPLDLAALAPGHPHHAALARIRDRLLPGADGLWWFRTCETFGTATGQAFAAGWTRFFGCRAAGHTHVIGFWQSGLHSLLPGAAPSWSPGEGLPPGQAPPGAALASGPRAPNTITCLHGRVPDGF
jgi:hypothetical protein